MHKLFATKGVFRPRNIAIMAMMAALTAILSQFSVFVSQQFRAISFAFLPGAMVSVMFGPWAGIAFGFVADTVAYIAKPGGPYFFGYALSEMVANFIYACLLYGRRITLPRVVVARLLVVVIVVFGLNFVWQSILYGAVAGVYFSSVRLISNLLQFPVYVGLIYAFAKLARQLESRAFVQG